MAKIKKNNPKQTSGGYERLFGNKELGLLVSKVQSAVISSGTELEKIVNQLVKQDDRIIDDIDEFLELDIVPNKVYVVPKKVLKNSTILDTGNEEPDFVVLKVQRNNKHCFIIELKDGDMFDTKKSAAEKKNLKKFESNVSTKLQYSTSIHICCFNQLNKETIIAGLKNVIDEKEAMTGQEFCELLQIDYNYILSERARDQSYNFEFFINELLNIKDVKNAISEKLTITDEY